MAVDRFWLAELVKGFTAADNVGCVTGLVFPLELETEAQLWFEQFGGFNKGYARQLLDLAENRPGHPLFPYAAGDFGTGANMAFRTAALHAIGGFNLALGPGTPALAGEELAAFIQTTKAGYTLAYEPGAIVHHMHRRDYAGLRKQMYGYGVGRTAHLTKCVFDCPSSVLDFTAKLLPGLVYARRTRLPRHTPEYSHLSKELNAIGKRGMLLGPFAYLWGRRQARKWKTLVTPQAEVPPTRQEVADELVKA